MGIRNKSSVAKKPDERQAAVSRHLHGEARRRRDGREHGYASDKCLLHNLKSSPAAHKKKPLGRQGSLQKRFAPFSYGPVHRSRAIMTF